MPFSVGVNIENLFLKQSSEKKPHLLEASL